MAPESPEFPITYYHPEAGRMQVFADAAELGAALEDFDTDDGRVATRQWLVDAKGRRVRARVIRTTAQRLEILPGRPPLPETLAAWREAALRTEEGLDGDARAALLGARVGAAVLLPTAALSAAWHWVSWAGAPFPPSGLDVAAVTVGLVGAVGVALAWLDERRFVFLGLAGCVAGGAALGGIRGFRLLAAFTAPGSPQGLFSLALSWVWQMAVPGVLFAVGSVLLAFFGTTFAAMARRRRVS